MISYKDSFSESRCYECGELVERDAAHLPLVVWSFIVMNPVPFHPGCCPGRGTESCRQCAREAEAARGEHS